MARKHQPTAPKNNEPRRRGEEDQWRDPDMEEQEERRMAGEFDEEDVAEGDELDDDEDEDEDEDEES